MFFLKKYSVPTLFCVNICTFKLEFIYFKSNAPSVMSQFLSPTDSKKIGLKPQVLWPFQKSWTLTHCTLKIIQTCKRSRSSSSRATTTPCLLTLVWRGRGCWGCCRGWTWCRGWCLFWCIGDLWLSRGEVGCELVYYRLFLMRSIHLFQCDNKLFFHLHTVLKKQFYVQNA